MNDQITYARLHRIWEHARRHAQGRMVLVLNSDDYEAVLAMFDDFQFLPVDKMCDFAVLTFDDGLITGSARVAKGRFVAAWDYGGRLDGALYQIEEVVKS